MNEDLEFCEQLELNLPELPFSIYDDSHVADLPSDTPNGCWLSAPSVVTF